MESILSKAVFTELYEFFLRPDNPPTPSHSHWELPVQAQGCTHLRLYFRFESGGGSKAAKRLGDFFIDRMRTQAMIKQRGEGLLSLLHNTLSPSLMAPFETVPALGCSSLEESYLSLTIQPSSRGQAG